MSVQYVLFFFFKQKTAYEMRISDWSSDGCSSDLLQATLVEQGGDDALVHSRFEVAVACDGVGSRVHVPLRQGESTLTVWEMRRPRPMAGRGRRGSRIRDRKSTRLNSSHYCASRIQSSPGQEHTHNTEPVSR